MERGVLVTGTDTGVGKTIASLLLLATLRSRGIPVAALKPVETGCDPDPQDALRLRAVSGAEDPLERVCPYRYRLPVAPQAAAAAEGRPVEITRLQAAFRQLSEGGRFVVVEGAGGAGTPYAPGVLGLHLASALAIPTLVVARAVLGTVGQTLVTLAALREAGVVCLGVLLNRVPGLAKGPDDATNADLIEAHSRGIPVLGTLPELPPPPLAAAPGALLTWAERHASCLPAALAEALSRSR